MLLTQPMPVAVWLDAADRPARLVYQGTALHDHRRADAAPRRPRLADRHHASPDAGTDRSGGGSRPASTTTGETLVFDLRRAAAEWHVVQVYA